MAVKHQASETEIRLRDRASEIEGRLRDQLLASEVRLRDQLQDAGVKLSAAEARVSTEKIELLVNGKELERQLRLTETRVSQSTVTLKICSVADLPEQRCEATEAKLKFELELNATKARLRVSLDFSLPPVSR